MGSAGVDYLAQVAAYPNPDEKLRTERLEVQGGGNCGNALTAAARLGLSPAIVTKIGGDAVGDGIIAEFHAEGVDTDCILRAPNASSPFTYIIVDRQGSTRTCIHTPGEAFHPSELTQQLINNALSGAELIYFDGRLTEAAVLLARAARVSGVPVLVEAERLRPGLEDLLQEADYVVTSAHFPGDWTGEQGVGDAVTSMFARIPRAQWMITTLGKKGSVLLERKSLLVQGRKKGEDGGSVAEKWIAQTLIDALFEHAGAAAAGAPPDSTNENADGPACVSASGVEIYAGGQATAPDAYSLILKRGGEKEEEEAVAASAARAAEAAAAANAAAGKAAAYQSSSAHATASRGTSEVHAIVTVSQAAVLPPDAVLDTTGAGDAFIGSLLYCLATGKGPRDAMKLGAVVAACKCTALGARPGLPHRHMIRKDLL